ncbi:MAG: SAM-dependent methyltransferase, partial [Gammaproteobacteria bacterium]
MSLPGTPERPPRLSVALISAAALGYEILLMRLFSIIQWHHFAYMIISLALLGYGASGTFIALARARLLARFAPAYWLNLILFGLSAVACYLLAQQVPFNAEEVLWDWHQPLWLLAIYLLLALPFFFAANAIALALSRYPAALARVYAADLLGAGLGALAVLVLLFWVFPGTALQALGVLGALAALVAARELRLPGRRWQGGALLCAAVLLALPGDWLEPRISPYKELSQALRVAGTEVIDRRSSPLGVLEVLASHNIPLRHAPGLSLRATAPIPEQLGLFTDAGGLSAIDRNPRRQPLAYLEQLTSALPYYLAQPEHVLILGTGGGAGVQQALNHRVAVIDAVELNSQVIELVTQDYGEWSGDLYQRPGVEVHIADARGYVRRSRRHYDLIQINLLDAYGAAGAGLPALNENYLYTVEALQEYLAHVAPGGYLVISRWISLPPRDTLKLLATAVEALERAGSRAPGSQLVLIRGWQTGTLLIKHEAFTEEELEAVRRFCRARSFDVAWYPGMQASEANHFNILRQPWLYEAAAALTGGRGAEFIRDYKFDITPPTD